MLATNTIICLMIATSCTTCAKINVIYGGGILPHRTPGICHIGVSIRELHLMKQYDLNYSS